MEAKQVFWQVPEIRLFEAGLSWAATADFYPVLCELHTGLCFFTYMVILMSSLYIKS